MWFKIHLKFEMLKLLKDSGGNILQVIHVSKTSGTGLQQPKEQVQEWTSWVTGNGTVSPQQRWLSAGSLQMGDSLCRSYLKCINNCKHETPQSCHPVNDTSMPHLIPRLGNGCRRGTERLLVAGTVGDSRGQCFPDTAGRLAGRLTAVVTANTRPASLDQIPSRREKVGTKSHAWMSS